MKLPGPSDDFAVKVAVITAALLSVGGLALMGYLAVMSHTIPDQLDRLTGAAFTGLLALLAATRTGTTPVTVENKPDDPVPTTDTPKPRK